MADVYDFIASYGRDSGIPNLQLNKEGFCSLNFDTVINVDIVFTQEHDQCTFASNIGDIPAVDQAGFFKELLKESAFGINTSGACLGIDDESNKVVMSYTFITQSFTYELFKTVLNNFVSLVEEWMGKVKDLSNKHNPSSESTLTSNMLDFIPA